jgi:spermidine synthase
MNRGIDTRGRELWFSERQSEDVTLGLRVRSVLWQERTPYQELLVLDTDAYGRVLVLDGAIQTTERDEFIYHEMIAHVPLAMHPHPRRVAVIGGGDGGAIREILKHPEVEEAHLVEIDGRVVEAARQFFPELAGALDDPRARVHITDGIDWIQAVDTPFDVVIVDSTDPMGPAEGLFGAAFYRAVAERLGEDGVMVAQSESPMLEPDVIRRAVSGMREAFPQVYLYTAAVPTYPTGLWSFTIGSKGPRPAPVRPGLETLPTRYWTPAVHQAAFQLPPFIAALTAQ